MTKVIRDSSGHAVAYEHDTERTINGKTFEFHALVTSESKKTIEKMKNDLHDQGYVVRVLKVQDCELEMYKRFDKEFHNRRIGYKR